MKNFIKPAIFKNLNDNTFHVGFLTNNTKLKKYFRCINAYEITSHHDFIAKADKLNLYDDAKATLHYFYKFNELKNSIYSEKFIKMFEYDENFQNNMYIATMTFQSNTFNLENDNLHCLLDDIKLYTSKYDNQLVSINIKS